MVQGLGKELKVGWEGLWLVCWEIGRVKNVRDNGMMMERLLKEVRSKILFGRISRLFFPP